MTAAVRAAAAGLLLVAVVLVAGAGHAAAAPFAAAAAPVAAKRALVPPVRPVPTQAPSLSGAPCLPVIGCDPLGGLAQDTAKSMARAVFDAYATFVVEGVRSALAQVSAAIDKTTTFELDHTWFEGHVALMRGLAVVILLPLMLVGLIGAVIQRDARQLLRAGGVYVPVAIVGGAAALGLTEMAISLTDGLTKAVTGDMAGNTGKALGALHDAIAVSAPSGVGGLGNFLAVVVLLVLLAGALLIWIELLVRTSAIYVVVLFLPLAMSGLVWRATVAWTRRMIEVLAALILSKFVIVVVIDLAAGMITANDGIATILQGATLLLLAGCAPFALLRLIPMVEAGVIGHLERVERRPIAAATRAGATATSALARIQTAGARQALTANGETPGPSAPPEIQGGELNDAQPPPGWSSASRRTRSSAAFGADDSGPAVAAIGARRDGEGGGDGGA